MSTVNILERHRKGLLPFDFDGKYAPRDLITERLYQCPNGWSLGARRGGRLHLADGDTWELFVLDPNGILSGEPVGFVDDATAALAADRLARYFDPEETS